MEQSDAVLREANPNIIPIIMNFVNTSTWNEALKYVEDHPELMTEGTNKVFAFLIKTAIEQDDNETTNLLRVHKDFIDIWQTDGKHEALRRIQARTEDSVLTCAHLLCNSYKLALSKKNSDLF